MYNILLLFVLAVVLIIGLHNIDKSLAQIFAYEAGNWILIFLFSGLVLVFVVWQMLRKP